MEYQLLCDYKKGSLKEREKIVNWFIKKYDKSIKKQAHKLVAYNENIEFDDAQQEILIKLLDIIEKVDITKINEKFKIHWFLINRGVLNIANTLRCKKYNRRTIAFSTYDNFDYGYNSNDFDCILEKKTNIEFFKRLSPRYRKIIKNLLKQKSINYIAEELQLSAQQIRNDMKSIEKQYVRFAY